MAAIDDLKRALEGDEAFSLVRADAAVALVKHVSSNEEPSLSNVQDLEQWRQKIRRWNEKFVWQDGAIEWL